MLKTERIYTKPADMTGCRILVDRLWPRGISKVNAHLNYWLKEVGPSNDLRKWFNHDPAKYAEFKQRYLAELKNNVAYSILKELVTSHADQDIILLYGAKDEQHNQAIILKELLEKELS
jgi:uncharacterized protein YeaO (DUF488 family)